MSLWVEGEFVKPDLHIIHQWIWAFFSLLRMTALIFGNCALCLCCKLQSTSVATAEDSLHVDMYVAAYTAQV